jgi:hypothetical protein
MSLGIILFTCASMSMLTYSKRSYYTSIVRSPFERRTSNKRPRINVDQLGDWIVLGSARWKSLIWKYLTSTNCTKEGKCEIEVQNHLKTDETVILCWVQEDGQLKHYYPIHPRNKIEDGSVSCIHVEHTQPGHVFACFRRSTVSSLSESNHRSSVRPRRRLLPKHVSDIPSQVASLLTDPVLMTSFS